ncbi:MAG: helix-turn-helix transcriptional regulator [Gammaproteobacteria bacterium]
MTYDSRNAATKGRRLIRSMSPEADARTGYKKSARAGKVLDGLLPPPIALGGRARAFLSDELDAVIAARASGACDDDIRALVRALVAARSATSGRIA